MSEQQTEEWFQTRIGCVTASRIADVIAKGQGLTRAAYRAEVVAERLTGQRYEGFSSPDTQRGTEMEPLGRGSYEMRMGILVEEVGFVPHPSIPMAGASPDGLVGDDGLVEIKSPRTHTHIDYLLSGKPPGKYVPQMAWQCACTGRKWVDFVSYEPRLPEPMQLFVVRYMPTREYIEELENEVRLFLTEVGETVMKLERFALEAA